MKRTVREMVPGDWPRVCEIYAQALEEGHSTFQVERPTWEAWSAAHRPDCRLVAEEDGRIVGWCAVSPTSAREAYRGVVEVSLYVAADARDRGVGRTLMEALARAAEEAGYWTVQAVIFADNAASLALFRACGYRVVGTRERIAVNRFGAWQDTVLLERRSAAL